MRIGTVWGLQFSAERNVFPAFFLAQALVSSYVYWMQHHPGWLALVVGLLAAVLHWLSVLTHHLGHAWLAQNTGHPMNGVHFWGPLAISRYPRAEGSLPDRVHIRRALGGPLASLALGMLTGLFWGLLPPHTWPRTLVGFIALDNLLVLTLGALMPLPFTDGGTLVKYAHRK